jgi:hypothetical protein
MSHLTLPFFASNTTPRSFSENSVYIMSILKASFDFLAAGHCQRSSWREISPDLVVKRMPVIKSAYTLLLAGADVLSLLKIWLFVIPFHPP